MTDPKMTAPSWLDRPVTVRSAFTFIGTIIVLDIVKDAIEIIWRLAHA